MKSLSLITLATAIGFSAAAPSPQGIAGLLVGGVVNAGLGKVPDPPGAAPKNITEKARAPHSNSQTVKLRYGPYKVPSMKTKNILGEAGTLWNYPDTAVDKPCSDCMVVGMNAGLEYPNGTNANIDTGLWLHHMVLLNIGPTRRDLTCASNSRSLPHQVVGSNPSRSERFFSSGNERTPVILNEFNATDVGYELKNEDKFALIVDLMNENMEDKLVYMTITYDFIPGRPQGMDNIKPVWFDVNQCGTSEVTAPQQSGKFQISSPVWTANTNGDIIGAGGHLHDGGESVNLEVDGKQICTSEATYGGKPEYVQKAPMGHANSATSHISSMTVCVGNKLPVTKVVEGQKWYLRANYNYDKYNGMLHDNGKQESIMGISIMYVRSKA